MRLPILSGILISLFFWRFLSHIHTVIIIIVYTHFNAITTTNLTTWDCQYFQKLQLTDYFEGFYWHTTIVVTSIIFNNYKDCSDARLLIVSVTLANELPIILLSQLCYYYYCIHIFLIITVASKLVLWDYQYF